MSYELFFVICAFIAMVIAVKPPSGWTWNFMCLSFAFLILAWLWVNGLRAHLHP